MVFTERKLISGLGIFSYYDLVLQAHSALLAEEEATALSVWTVACLCGNLRLEHVRVYPFDHF